MQRNRKAKYFKTCLIVFIFATIYVKHLSFHLYEYNVSFVYIAYSFEY